MKRVWIAFVLAALAGALPAAAEPPDAVAELTALLRAFLSGVNDPAVHDAFWAEDLIYTRSSGARIGKADILRDMRDAPPPAPEDPVTAYDAEEIRIQQYGDTAVLAFRLVATTPTAGRPEVMSFFNTGTFVRRDGAWKAVAWQATRIPPVESEVARDVTALHAAFQAALLGPDVQTLERLLDPSFVWTHGGEQMGEEELLGHLRAGTLKFAVLTTGESTVSVPGDAAILRGTWSWERSAVPGGAADTGPRTTPFTLVFVRQSGAWKVVSLHTSKA